MGWLLLTLGVALWWGAHLFKRVAPEARARMGEPGKGVVAILLVVSIVLMTIGYKNAGGPVWWGRSSALVGVNNLLMLFAFYLFAASGAKTRITQIIRHPQLTAFKVWAAAHLLVNGDLASFVLFGGLLAWAIVTVIILNRAEPNWEPAHAIPIKKEITAIVAATIATAVVMPIHHWIGVTPWG